MTTSTRDQGPGWEARTRIVALVLFLMALAFVLGRTGRDALYVLQGGMFDLPKAYLGIASLSLPLAATMTVLMWSLGVRRTRVLATFAGAVALVAYSRVARPGGGLLMTLCFTLLPLGFGVLFSMAWLLGADLLGRAPREVLRRAYGRIGAASIAGGVAGGACARLLAAHVDPGLLILLAALVLSASGVVMVTAHRACRRPAGVGAARHTRTLLTELGSLVRQTYVFRLLVVAVMAGLVGVLIEFQFYLAAAVMPGDLHSHTRFFANVYLVLNAGAFAVQLLLMSRLQRVIGVNGSLMILPAVLAGGAISLLANASGVLRAGIRIAEGGLKSSIHRSNWEQAYLPIGPAERGVAKLMVDGMGARLGEGAAAGLLYLWLRVGATEVGHVGRGVAWLTWMVLIGTILWLVLTRRLGSEIARCMSTPAIAGTARVDAPLPEG